MVGLGSRSPFVAGDLEGTEVPLTSLVKKHAQCTGIWRRAGEEATRGWRAKRRRPRGQAVLPNPCPPKEESKEASLTLAWSLLDVSTKESGTQVLQRALQPGPSQTHTPLPHHSSKLHWVLTPHWYGRLPLRICAIPGNSVGEACRKGDFSIPVQPSSP